MAIKLHDYAQRGTAASSEARGNASDRPDGVTDQFERLAAPPSAHMLFVGGLIVAGLLAILTWVTWAAGGTRSAVPHLFYLPVLLGAYYGATPGGLAVGIAAGLLCGPLMPLDVDAGTSQSLFNWTVRMACFVIVGAIAGMLFRGLRQRIHQLATFSDESIAAFVRTVDAKSPFTARHSENVAALALAIGEELGYKRHALRRLGWAALLHDIGKLRIPDEILNCPARLSDDQFAIMRTHPVESVRILSGIEQFAECLPAIRHHHERMDGEGYPDGLPGHELSQDARILAVADAFEAMTADRPYRAGMSPEQAMKRLREGAGTQFDPTIVEVFITAYAAGHVRLNRWYPALMAAS